MQIGWQDWKTAIADHANLSRDALHIYAALLIFIVACRMFRWQPSEWKPWLLVLLAQCINEALDMRDMLIDDGVIWIWASVKDTLNTMIAPSLLLFAARKFEIFGAPRAESTQSGDEAQVAAATAGGEDDVG